MHIAEDADNLPCCGVASILVRADVRVAFAQRVFIGKVAVGERLVDDRRPDPPATLILFREVAAFAQGNPDRLKVLRGDAAIIGGRLLSRFGFGAALDPEIASNVVAAERRRGDERGALGAREGTEPVERLSSVKAGYYDKFTRSSRRCCP